MAKSLQFLTLAALMATPLAQSHAAGPLPDDSPDYTTPSHGRHASADYRPGEVIVKLRNASPAGIRTLSSGRVAAVNSSPLTSILTKYGVTSATPLMPLTATKVSTVRAKAYNGRTVADDDLTKLLCLSFTPSASTDLMKLIDELSVLPEVEFAEPNYIVYASDVTDYTGEPMYAQQWGIPAIGLDKLWAEPSLSDTRKVIAILDTGVDVEHPDLKANLWTNPMEAEGTSDSDDDGNGFADDIHGYDFVNKSGRMRDNNGHGTHCAGIAAATGNNGVGVVGANPDALIMPIAVLQSDGTGDIATIIKGVDYAAANGADVVSMSFGTYSHSKAFEQALGKAYQRAVLVAAAGNDDRCIYPHYCLVNKQPGATMFPAAYSFVLGVQASMDADGTLASFSNFDEDGPITSTFTDLYNYELTAPGTSILSTFLGGQYRQLNGTSMACPLVAGAISRLLQAKEYASKEELFGDLIHSARGNVDIYSAFRLTDADRRPTLSLVTYRLDDAKMGDGDGRPDAGETILLYPTFRNDWGNARNITYTLTLAETEDPDIVEHLDPDPIHATNDLSSYATAEAASPIMLKINPECVDGRKIRFTLRATCDGISSPLEQEIVLTAENGIELGGVLREDMTLTPDKNYIITSLLGVPDGRTLTILPGTTLKFKDGSGLSVASGGKVIAHGEPGNMITFTKADFDQGLIQGFIFNNYVSYHNNVMSTSGEPLSYIKISQLSFRSRFFSNYHFINSIFENLERGTLLFSSGIIDKCNVNDISSNTFSNTHFLFKRSNITNIQQESRYNEYFIGNIRSAYSTDNCNVFGNYYGSDPMAFSYYNETPAFYTPEEPNYFGSARQDIVQPMILDIKNTRTDQYGNPLSSSFGEYDLSNMLTRPTPEAHGIVWKVVVNGYDAQDEYEQLPPLGVGRHKFEVYFNRPMNREKAPMIAMGVRAPFTQTAIAEDGTWNEAGDIYTAYLTIKGRDNYDGVNTIYVAEAEDDEFFPIPTENFRFRVNVQSAGSMSTGFEATPGLGKVTLTWDNPEENVNDLLGYNLYRYTLNEQNEPGDTVRINPTLLDTELFTDFDVTPGTTYCYYYKVMTTALTENSPSRTVATTPLTSVKGDANGSMEVDVADIVSEVGYMLGHNPQPFIFDAADVNSDAEIDVLDVVGTVNIITGSSQPDAAVASTVTYTVEDGVLYVDSPVEMGGVQLCLTGLDADAEVTPLETLDGFEVMGSRDSDGNYLLIAFSLSGRSIAAGKQPLLRIGSADIDRIVISDIYGRNLPAIAGAMSGIGKVMGLQMRPAYPNPCGAELNVPFIIGLEGNHEVRITLTNLSGMTVMTAGGNYSFGQHAVRLDTGALPAGFYLLNLRVDGAMMQTQKVIKL